MSLLAPLYIAGLLAIAAPIIFHLIRRTPQGRQLFSSLMFLDPSPPRITRRSRLNNILLLILRAAALAVLAFAFARPFFKQQASAEVNETRGKRVALLVDTSASMRRGDTWNRARAEVENALRDLSPADEVGLFLFDRTVRPVMTFREWNELDGPSRRAAMLRARLAEAGPTWDGTDLAAALSTVADMLIETDGKNAVADSMGRQIVLVSDLQRGSRFEALQGYEWPKNVTLEVRSVAPQQPGNAGVQLVEDRDGAPAADADGRLRVRVTNQPLSQREQFTLQWADERGPLAGVAPVKAYVAPGRNQVVRVARPTTAPSQADRLLLAGDEADFDNTLYIAPRATDAVRIVYVGDDAPDDAKGLLFFLRSAAGDSPGRKVELASRKSSEKLMDAELLGARLVVVTTPLADDRAATLRRFAEAGGDVLWALTGADAGTGFAALLPGASVEEASGGHYALISRVATDHPLFAPFADPRFGDFTKIHFWKHRRVTLPKDSPARTIAWFDNGDPFLLEAPIGKGRVLVATAGWHPADSQLALSTKFVPLIDGLLKRPDGALVGSQYAVHDRIALPAAQNPAETRFVTGPDGRRVELPAGATTFDGADRPGIYRLHYNGKETPLAVNLPPDESRTSPPLAVEELEQLGARLHARSAPAGEIAQQRRQLQVVELENRQKLWRWLIVGVLVLLVAETALAGRLAHRTAREQVAA